MQLDDATSKWRDEYFASSIDSSTREERSINLTEGSPLCSYPNTTVRLLIDKCSQPLEVIYFLKYNKENCVEFENAIKEWPCEVRNYFHDIQNYIYFVKFLFEYGSFGLITIGLIVNTYSLFVLSSPPINKSTIAIYLKALAFSDMGALIFNVGISVLRARVQHFNDFYTDNQIMCYLHRILSTIFFNFSTWLVVILTFERMLMVKYPFKITCHNKRLAKVAIAILALIAMIVSICRGMLNGFEKDNMYGYRPCGKNDHKINIKMLAFICANLLLPIVLVTIANICLFINVKRSAQNRTTLKGNLKVSDDQSNKIKATRMVIIISVVYILLYLPLGIIAMVDVVHKQLEPESTDENYLENYIAWRKGWLILKYTRSLCFFLHLMIYVNNFFLYCLSGNIFRQTVKVCLPTFLHKICPTLVRKPQLLRQTTRSTQIYHHSSTKNLSTRKNMDKENSYTNKSFIKD